MGVLYNIDEDAYGLLNSYLNGMKDYFARLGADEEVAQDVEYRVGELMAEVKERGSGVITIEDVRVICERVGAPEQMGDGPGGDMGGGSGSATGIDSGSATGSDASGGGTGENSRDSAEGEDSGDGSGAGAGEPVGEGWYDGVKRRRLYRDERKKWLGGVLAGVASYAGGGDPVPWRIAFVLLCIVGGSHGGPFLFLLFAYVLLWAFLPVAATPEDRLRQRGCEVNAQNVHNEILNEAAGGGDGCASGTGAGASAAAGGAAAGGGEHGGPSRVVKGCLVGCLAVPVGCFALLMIMAMTPVLGMLVSFFDILVVVGMLSLVAVVVIPVVALLHALFGSTNWSVGTRVCMLALWLVSLLGMWYGINWGVEKFRWESDSIGLLWRRMISLPGVSVQVNGYDVDDTLGTDSVGGVSVVIGGNAGGVRVGVGADSVAVRVGNDSSVVRVNVKDNKGLPEDSAVEVFPEEAE